jgi:ubiquinone/menaquinone biosynthesis C-methylase UbiE
MTQNWINAQAESNVKQFDESMDAFNTNASSFLFDSDKYFQRVCVDCNYLDAIKLVNWDLHLKHNSVILDMGSGGGWLAGYLSSFKHVKTVNTLDSSKYFLYQMMPKILKKMAADEKKIIPIEGLFTPILFDDESIDMVVASSALHHADNLELVLKEIRRVLKKDGSLIVLNETPDSATRHFLRVTKACLSILKNLLFKNYFSISAAVSSSGFLYDPHLGDRAYPVWYWKKAFKLSGFNEVEKVDSGMPTVKKSKGPSLVHFICK